MAWFFLGLAALLLLLQLLILLPPVQDKLKDLAVSAIEDNLDVEASIGFFRMAFPKKIRVGEVLMVAGDADTLISLGELSVNVAILPLLNKKIVVQNLELQNLRGDIGKVIALTSSPADTTAAEPEPLPDPSTADDGKPWTFGVRHLDLVSIDLELRDEESGIDLGMQVGQIRISLGDINLDSLIHVKSVSIARTNASLELLESLPSIEEPDTGGFSFANITVGELLLDDVGFTLIDSVSGMMLYTHAGTLSSDDNFVDITHATIGVDEVALGDSWCDIVFLPGGDTVPSAPTEGDDYLNWGQYLWRITGNQLVMENCRYTMEYRGEPELKGHFDPLHMHITEAFGEISDFKLDADTLVARISNLRAKDPGGLELLRFDADISQEDNLLFIRDMRIETPNTELSLALGTSANPTNYSGLDKEMFDLRLDIDGMNWRDADYFYPFLEDQDLLTGSFGSGSFELGLGISGSLNELNIQDLVFRSLDSTTISMKGALTNGMDPEAMQAELIIREVSTTRSEMNRNFKLGIPDSVFRLPRWFELTGALSAGKGIYGFGGMIESSNGRIVISQAEYSAGEQPHSKVSMMAGLYHLDELADLGVEETMFHLDADFLGDDPATMKGELELLVDTLTYRSFQYTGLDLKGAIENGDFNVSLNAEMPECLVSLLATGHVTGDDLMVDLTADIENLDLYALNLHDTSFILKSQTNLVLGMHPDDAYDVELHLKSLDLSLRDSLYRMHPVDLTFKTGRGNTTLDLESYFYQLTFAADANITDVADAFIRLPGYYLSDKPLDTILFTMPEFSVSGRLEYPRAFASLFFPELPEFDEFTINGGYSKVTDKLTVDLFFPLLRAGSLQTDSLYLSVSGSSEELDYETAARLTITDLMSGKAIVKGMFKDSELTTNLIYEDSYGNEYINLIARIDTSHGNVLVHLLPPALTFSYDPWEVDPSNLVTIHPDFVEFQNLELVKGREKISISMFGDDSPELRLTDFSLGSLEQLFATDTVVGGTANADIRFHDPLGNLAVEGSLMIDNLLLYDFEAGRLDVSQFDYTKDTVDVTLALQGTKQDILVKGVWIAADSVSPLFAELKINSLNLSELNYLLEDYISDAKGDLTGDIIISGRTSDPQVSGNLAFKEAGMGIDFLNNYFSLGTEAITIENNVYRFDGFKIRNKQNQSATINGSINLGDLSNAYSDLVVKTDNMVIMNSTRKENDILFGLLKAQAEVEAKGEMKNIRLNANVTIDKSTDVTYIFPDNLALDNNEGVVRYKKFDPSMRPDEDISKSTAFFSMESFRNVRSRIEVQSGARFNLFFDNSGDNFLDAALEGSINYRQVQDNTEISGMFQVEEGVLHYGIPMVAVDEYEIEPGSTISLSNDLYNPYLSIVASSSVRASTEGLMASDPKVMTFKVLLYMQGELNDVKLRFDISQETGDALVSARLSQLTDEERNMNALNLLVRGSFMMSLQGDELGGTTTMDAQIDKFYTTHLNHLISENVKFVDLKFDVQSFKEYNTSGDAVLQRNYYYNVGKSFFNDRARINYKGSLGVTNDMETEQVNSRFVQNELEMEVKITRDGVLRGVFFRKNQYEGLLEGEVIETGGGIRLRKDFYSIGDIFTNEKRQLQKLNEDSGPGNTGTIDK